MNIIGKSLPFVFLLCGVVGFAALKSLRSDPPSADTEELAPLVETVSVEECTDGFHIRVDGEVIPFREISLAAQVAGRIQMKSPQAKAGNYVRQGGLLFEIDPRDYQLDARISREQVNQASSSIEEADVEKSNVERLIELAEEELELQRKETTRNQQLKARNAASTAQLDAARRAEIQALNSLQTLRNQILAVNARRNRLAQEKERAISSLDKALLGLSRTKITSPINRGCHRGFFRTGRFCTGRHTSCAAGRHVEGRGQVQLAFGAVAMALDNAFVNNNSSDFGEQ